MQHIDFCLFLIIYAVNTHKSSSSSSSSVLRPWNYTISKCEGNISENHHKSLKCAHQRTTCCLKWIELNWNSIRTFSMHARAQSENTKIKNGQNYEWLKCLSLSLFTFACVYSLCILKLKRCNFNLFEQL